MATAAPPPWLVPLVESFHSSNTVRLAVPFVLFGALLVAARGRGALRLSAPTRRSVLVTLSLLVVNGILARWLVLRIDLTTSPWAALGLPHLQSERAAALWAGLPWPVTLVMVLLALDVADYWTHRLMHNSPLWGVHAVHHTEQRMTWLTSSRVHVFETSIMKLGYLGLLGWTGLPLWALATASAVAYLHNRYVHCDVGWGHGPLDKLIASPNWHRWHHSIDPAAHNRNYANIFSCLDVVFGTYHNPGPCRTPVGLDDVPRPTLAALLLLPVTDLTRRYRRWRRRATAGPSPTSANELNARPILDAEFR